MLVLKPQIVNCQMQLLIVVNLGGISMANMSLFIAGLKYCLHSLYLYFACDYSCIASRW